MASVDLQNIRKRYGALEVIKGLNLSVDDGSFTALLGPSGCGKSTLLRMIAGLEEITEGKALIGGVDVTHEVPAKRRVAMVFQSYALYPHLTVAQNICFSLSLAGASRAVQAEKGGKVARLLQLEELMNRRPAQLSGANGSGLPSAGHWSATPRCSCSTNHCRISMPCCGCRCGWSWPSCTMN